MGPPAPKIHSVHLGRRESTHLLRGRTLKGGPHCAKDTLRASWAQREHANPPEIHRCPPAPKIQESKRILHQRSRRAGESSRGSQVPYYTKDTLRASWALREHAFTPGTVRGRWLHCTKDTLRASWVQGEIPTASAIHSERWSPCADDTLRASGAQRTHPSLRGGS